MHNPLGPQIIKRIRVVVFSLGNARKEAVIQEAPLQDEMDKRVKGVPDEEGAEGCRG
jgi:hypothetical protein